jgi:hypothetical protein
MHTKHADSNGLNDLSRRVIGCALTVLNTLEPRLRIKRVAHGL